MIITTVTKIIILVITTSDTVIAKTTIIRKRKRREIGERKRRGRDREKSLLTHSEHTYSIITTKPSFICHSSRRINELQYPETPRTDMKRMITTCGYNTFPAMYDNAKLYDNTLPVMYDNTKRLSR